ncbi:MAG: hypothetical protein AAF682_14550 [Planctomycetota bacterium]
MSGSLGLEGLPVLTRSFADAVASSSERLSRRALEAAAAGGAAASPLLRRVSFGWQLQIEKTATEVRLFFLRKRFSMLAVDAELDLAVEPVPLEASPARYRPAEIDFRFVVPPFIRATPTAGEVALATAGRSRRPAEVALLELGPNGGYLLTVLRPRRLERATILLRDPAGEVAVLKPDPDTGRWPLPPFLLLLDAVAAWATGAVGGRRIPFSPSGADTDAERIVRQFVRAYGAAVEALAVRSEAPVNRVAAAFALHYGVASARASLALRLRPDGNLAAADDEHSFQLAMKLAVRPERGRTALDMELGVPDFLAEGELRDELIASLGTPAAVRRLVREFAGPASGGALAGLSQREVRWFLRQAAATCFVFRIERKLENSRRRRDTDIFALRGLLRGRERLLLLRASFDVDDGAELRIRLDAGSITALYLGHPSGRDGGLGPKTVRYFMALVLSIHRWMGVLEV